MFQNKKGFTLIELMVVIAIIAILATVVLVALQGARDAAKDSKISSAVTQARSIAEIYYATNEQSYTGFTAEPDYAHLMQDNDINLIHGISATGDAYCVTQALTTAGEHFCLSNTEGPRKYVTADDGAIVCTGTVATCLAP